MHIHKKKYKYASLTRFRVEVCEKIREYEKFHKLPRVPIVLITAYCQTVELQKQCFNAVVDKILTKPIVDESIWKSLLAEAVR